MLGRYKIADFLKKGLPHLKIWVGACKVKGNSLNGVHNFIVYTHT